MGLSNPAFLASTRRWSPARLAPDFWVDASRSSSLSLDGTDGVAQWSDLSGNGRHAAQNLAARRPKSGVAALAGLNGVRFTRVDQQFLTLGNVMELRLFSYSWAVILRRQTNNGTIQGIIGKNIAGSTDGRYGAYFLGGAFSLYDHGTQVNPSIPIAVATPTLLTSIVERNGASSTIKFRRDRGAAIAGSGFADTPTDWVTGVPWEIGSYGGAANFLDADVFEIVFSLRAWTPAELAMLESYLATKWGTP